MTQNYVINSITKELLTELSSCAPHEYYQVCSKHIQRALVVGTEHFTKEMEEIIALDRFGNEQRFKGVREASDKLGVPRGNIYMVMDGRRPTAGGFVFMRNKDKQLIQKKQTA